MIADGHSQQRAHLTRQKFTVTIPYCMEQSSSVSSFRFVLKPLYDSRLEDLPDLRVRNHKFCSLIFSANPCQIAGQIKNAPQIFM